MTKKEIAKVIKATRKEKGLSLYRLNKDHSIQRNQILAIERGDKQYTIDSLLAVAGALGITIHTSPN